MFLVKNYHDTFEFVEVTYKILLVSFFVTQCNLYSTVKTTNYDNLKLYILLLYANQQKLPLR